VGQLLGIARAAVPVYASGGFHLEHFHDHVRVEDAVFAAAPRPHEGLLAPPDRPGLGLEPR
jgi:L-alanine-DL-glutamate epimerase-like enolase superfamily enzyme